MRRYTAGRARVITLRAILGELGYVTLTQPLWPAYYAWGRRMGATRGGTPVIFVHGYLHNRVGFLGLARALNRAAQTRPVGTLFGFNYPWLDGIEQNAERLRLFVDGVCRETGADRVDLVCHSMGGLVGRRCIAKGAPVRRLVTLATPHHGVVFTGPVLGASGVDLKRGSPFMDAIEREPITVPTLNLYSTHDNIVHPVETSHLAASPLVTNIEAGDMGHLSILFSRRSRDAVVEFLGASEAVS
jgi:pimeloyl-ACP methyl ester carboxylesterase